MPADDSHPSEATLISWAQNVVRHDMGLKDEDLLDEAFYFIGPFDGPVGKRPFVDGSKTFDLRGAFPDFDFHEHDFRVDKVQPLRVWFTTRKTGTHKGVLPMYGQVIQPTDKQLDLPPETYSCTFNTQGKVVKLTGGFVMDSQQGNSGGLGGPLGIAAAVGAPRPLYVHTPPVQALTHAITGLFARLVSGGRAEQAPYVPPSTTKLSKDRLLSLGRLVLEEEEMGLKNPDRLADTFVYHEPLLSHSLDKATFLSRQKDINLRGAFPDLDMQVYNVYIDGSGVAPSTAWLTVRFKGTHTGGAVGGGRPIIPAGTGLVYESAPEIVSITFGDDEKVSRISAAAVLDREEGNTGGLGGVAGVKYALGRPSLPLVTRPLRFHSTQEWADAIKAAMGLSRKRPSESDGATDAKAQKTCGAGEEKGTSTST